MNPTTITRITLQEELEAAFVIRKEVFVEEQGVPLADEYDQFDTLEAPCEHILAYYDGNPVGTGRIRIVDGIGKIERICVLESYRQYGIGKKIICILEEIAVEQGLRKVKLHGQTQAQGFYEKLGYLAASEEFVEDGIPHVVMTKDLPFIQ
ncbi:putative acetyltransferase [Paenibacillus sp. CCS19]|uniref:GNAT family N-acetyltransferase n=1 Tax=Paenibacillus sp. CCS19 TaxID=3158387 RepID=UPI0025638618|nr:GNAT family N-acetyltransferase [Paenibacillus cellulosilyticus]GMK37616.1 putative acetyltransferase [Paenibacillus cellulosilyticus]